MILDYMIKLLDHWQTLVGSAIGAITPLFILWYVEWNKSKKEKKEYLYFLERVIVDQINALIETENTIKNFISTKIKTLLNHIDENPDDAYSVDSIFFPLFSVRSLPEDVNRTSSGSGYIDNKIGKIYAVSKDFPHIIDDLRLQLKHTLDINEKMSVMKLNSAQAQKNQLKRNILEYEKVLKDELLGKNIPIFTKLLAETLVSIRKRNTLGSLFWVIKFDPKWKFYKTKTEYKIAREKIMNDMDICFKQDTNLLLKEIEGWR